MRCLALFAALLLLACSSPTVWAHEGHSSSPDPPAETSAAQSAAAALFPSPAANSDKDSVDKQKAQQKWNIEHGLGEEEEGEGSSSRGRQTAALSQSAGSAAQLSSPVPTFDPPLTHSLIRCFFLLLLFASLVCLDPPGVPSTLPVADPLPQSPLPVVPPVVHSKPLALSPVTKPIPEQIVGVGQ